MQRKLLNENHFYYVYSDGHIENANGHIMKLYSDKAGYCSIVINGKRFLIHRLVARAFISNYSDNMQVHHVDGNRADNRVENLMCLTAKEHQHIHKQKYEAEKICCICGKRFTPSPTKRKSAQTCSRECFIKLAKARASNRKVRIVQCDLDGKIIKEWESARDCQNETGFYESNINKCCNGHIKTYKGYKWCYSH